MVIKSPTYLLCFHSARSSFHRSFRMFCTEKTKRRAYSSTHCWTSSISLAFVSDPFRLVVFVRATENDHMSLKSCRLNLASLVHTDSPVPFLGVSHLISNLVVRRGEMANDDG